MQTPATPQQCEGESRQEEELGGGGDGIAGARKCGDMHTGDEDVGKERPPHRSGHRHGV